MYIEQCAILYDAACLVQRSGWTRDVDMFLHWLGSIRFCGGGFGEVAIAEGLAEALMVCKYVFVLFYHRLCATLVAHNVHRCEINDDWKGLKTARAFLVFWMYETLEFIIWNRIYKNCKITWCYFVFLMASLLIADNILLLEFVSCSKLISH